MTDWAHARRKFVDAQKVQPKGKTGRADIARNLINKLYSIERDIKDMVDEQRHETRQRRCLPILAQLHGWFTLRVGRNCVHTHTAFCNCLDQVLVAYG
jgi:hypothetical protein